MYRSKYILPFLFKHSCVGCFEGLKLRLIEGFLVGSSEGLSDDSSEGFIVGSLVVGVLVVGGMLGISIESRVGDMLGSGVGVYVGPSQPEQVPKQ